MITKKKGALGAAICLVVILLSVLINPSYSKYVLGKSGEILHSVITAPPLTVTFMNDGEIVEIRSVGYGEEVVINQNDSLGAEPSHENATFDGWLNAVGVKPTSITVTRSVVLNAKWKIENYINLIVLDYEGTIVLEKHYPQGADPLTSDERTTLDSMPASLSSQLSEEYSDVGLSVVVTWDGQYDADTLMASTTDVIIRQKTEVSMSTTGGGNIQLTPKEDANNDGFPDGYRVSGVKEDDGNIHIVIPDYILDSPVDEIDMGAFAEFDNITTIRIPTTIKTIGADAFADKENVGILNTLKYEQITFLYEGTYAQWQAIEKDENWDRYVGQGSKIYFLADGTFIEETAKNGTWSASDRAWSDPKEGTYSA